MSSVLPTPTDCCSAPCGTTICIPTPFPEVACGVFVVADITALRAIAASEYNKIAFVTAGDPQTLREWYWSNSSTATDDGTVGTTVVKPSSSTVATPGRWLQWVD